MGSIIDNKHNKMCLTAISLGSDFSEYLRLLSADMEETFVFQKSETYFVMPPTPLETLYLKLTQHEYLGQVKDLLTIHNILLDTAYNVPAEYIEEMKKLHISIVGKEDFDTYFETENVQKIARFVYLKPKTTKEERRKIRNYKEKVYRLLHFFIYTEPDAKMIDDVTELLIVSCLQAIILNPQKEIFDYTFYGFEGKKGNRKGKIYVQAALKKDDHVPTALQAYWCLKVESRYYAN